MADYFSSSPNFVNPSYATPEQVAQQRAYAAELTKRSGENVNRPAGAFANMITALTAGIERNRANELQNQAAGQNASDLSDLITQLQSGNVNPQTAARVYANPMASPEHRALVGALIAPKAVEDVYGRPGTVSPAAGVRALPVQGNFQPGYRAPESAGSVATTTPFPAPGVPPTAGAPVMAPRAPVPSSPNVWGDKEAEAAGLYPPSGGGGGQASGAGLPPAPAPAVSPASRIESLAATDRRLSAEKARTESGAKAEGSVIESDVKRAASAPETLKGLGIMKNTIESVGDAMTFGPTAKMSNEARRVIANYAPGLVDEKALAGADAIEKLNLGLAGALSSQLGLNPSDIYRSVASVPGNEKSKAGTLALINMMEQAARNDQYVGTEIYQNSKGNLDAYQLARAAYYQHHPIVNPITGNPVQIDAKNAPAAPTGGVVNVSTPEEAAKLPKGTRFRAPDGSIRMVP
jgi:hypothetical protein